AGSSAAVPLLRLLVRFVPYLVPYQRGHMYVENTYNP
ncbi:MAG: hypothetical protein Greene041639_125, partial [Parcubacteria group bacterium Greene0416_39]